MKTGRDWPLAVALLFLCGCSPAVRTNIASVVHRAAQGAASAESPTTTSVKLMIFGGDDHKTYLGCLNCSQYVVDSVFNTYGEHGSHYSSDSIWNHYSEYGSAYSSACNPYAADPPVIVDSSGTYYGRLTLNSYHAGIGAGGRYYDWLHKTVCESN